MADVKSVSIRQACALIGVSRRTIYHWMRANKIQYYKLASGSVRIVASSLTVDGNVPAPSVTTADLAQVAI